MTQCAVCGTNNTNGSAFCVGCGARMMDTARAAVATVIADPPVRGGFVPAREPTFAAGFTRIADGDHPRHAPAVTDPIPRPYLSLVAGRSELVVAHGGAATTVFELRTKTSVGRSSENDIALRETTISRHHAMLVEDGGQWVVQDCNSGLGTHVAGERVAGWRPLHDGDEIAIGEFVFLFRA